MQRCTCSHERSVVSWCWSTGHNGNMWVLFLSRWYNSISLFILRSTSNDPSIICFYLWPIELWFIKFCSVNWKDSSRGKTFANILLRQTFVPRRHKELNKFHSRLVHRLVHMMYAHILWGPGHNRSSEVQNTLCLRAVTRQCSEEAREQCWYVHLLPA